jgi:tetratricopeptide (TPR) repeat protein
MHSQGESSTLLEFERLIPDSVGVAMRVASASEFLHWVQQSLANYATEQSLVVADQALARALAFAWARAVWNGLPLDVGGRKPKRMPDPAADAQCPCGSGETFADCCRDMPHIPPLAPSVLWPYVLANIQPAERAMLLAGNRVPRAALIEFAAYLLDHDRRGEVIAALEPRLASPERYHDEEMALLLDLLCEAYGMSEKGARRKLKLLHMTTEKAPRSPLRSEAWQRLATIYMDRRENERAWRAFRHAQQDHPHADALSVLEVELLVAERRLDEARYRAKFWATALKRSGISAGDPRIEFLQRVAADPVLALGEIAINIDGSGRQLREWLQAVQDRPAPVYELQPHKGAFVLKPPPGVAAAERKWHEVFPLDKPFSVQDQPFDNHEIWHEVGETYWCDFLRAHPECFDSVDILDDLATAIARHPQAEAPGLDDLLLAPVLARNEAILALTPTHDGKVAALPWVSASNRPALRGLMRSVQWQLARDERARAVSTAELLLAFNRDDNHGVRFMLMNEYLRSGSDEKALALAQQYPRDLAPETRFGAVLALVRLHRLQEAERALSRAREDLPKTAQYLLPARIRRPRIREDSIEVGGDDQAWLYRDEMRAVWQQTPGALEWLRAHF